ncbi:MAG: SapC family protein [Pseudomonadota bacterium]
MTSPIFYNSVVPLDKEAHAQLKITSPKAPLSFASSAQLVPAIVSEFDAAMREIGIAFLPAQPHPTAVFVCGLKADENAYINAKGLWKTEYVPAYLRRYPFIIGDTPDGGAVLCIDESYSGFSKKSGERLFTAKGEPGEPINRGLALAQGYQEAARQTDAFCAALNDLGLFRSVSLNATLPSGEQTSVHGLMVIDEGALSDLSGADLEALQKEGFLKAAYAHLFSLAAISGIGLLLGDENSEKKEEERLNTGD